MTQEALPIARSIIQKVGAANVARIVGMGRTNIYRWTRPKSKGGTGGVIPPFAQLALMEAARRGEIELEAEDFFRSGD
jgi:hypothetical protein